MNEQVEKKSEQQLTGDQAEAFFKDIEIEFLVHELKDPIAVIETGLRTLLERQDKFGKLNSRQENTLRRALRTASQSPGDRTLGSRMLYR